MDTMRQAELLARLRFLDQTEARAIDAALPKIQDEGLRSELEKARADHERHEREIDALFGECGENIHATVPETVKAQAEQRVAAVRRAGDEQSVISALLASEQADANAYAAADSAMLPADEGPAMRAHLADEKRHITELSSRLHHRV